MKVGQTLVVACGQMVHGGLCVAHVDGDTTVLVEGAIPGETVEVELRFRKGRTWFAHVNAVPDASPDRREPPCRYVPECGGCQLQHVADARQLELKRDVLVDSLSRQHVVHPEEIPVYGAADPWRYRWRGEFHVIPGPGGVTDARLGFNRARSWRPIAIDDCLITHPSIAEALPALRDLVRAGGAPELSTLHVTAGENGGELLLRGKPRSALPQTAVDAASLRMKGGRRFSTDSTSLHWHGHAYRVTPDSFVQVNWQQMDTLYARVTDGLGAYDGHRIVDAYAGVGVLAVELAARAGEVVCIESNRSAARMGVLNARLNDVADRVRYVLAPVEESLPRVAAQSTIDAVILDPPRAGCAGAVTGWLALAGPRRLVYVSCDPASLARDLRILVASGPYRFDRLELVDMFPQTYHVEAVATLTRPE